MSSTDDEPENYPNGCCLFFGVAFIMVGCLALTMFRRLIWRFLE